MGRYRVVLELDEGPAETLELLREVFAGNDIRILSETSGHELGTHRLPDGYVLLQVAAVWAVERAVAIDPTVPAAATFAVAVFAVDGGSAIAVTRPFAEAWLYGDPELSKIDHGPHAARLRGAREAVGAFRRRADHWRRQATGASAGRRPAVAAVRRAICLLPLEQRRRQQGRGQADAADDRELEQAGSVAVPGIDQRDHHVVERQRLGEGDHPDR